MSLAARSRPDQAGAAAAASGEARSGQGWWRRHRRRLAVCAPVGVVVVAIAVFGLFAADYQPLRQGNGGGGSFPGLRTGTGIRWVSRYVPGGPELYVPPQRESFALAGSVVNSGSFPITIVGVSQQPGSPFTAAGPVRYLTSAGWDRASLGHPVRHLLRDVTLAPGEGIMIGMPLRIAFCASRRSYTGEDVFIVKEKFLGFTHAVLIPFVDYSHPVITNASGGKPGPPGSYCSG
ncbi:MAG TPA: hypothetical protein VFI65_14620 [Streptosporangiaceae bacterium]|nr:hypothetical protein [Streptosporangiaceae bacterium]